MTEKTRVPLNRVLLFWAIALGGASFDLWTKSAVFESLGSPGIGGSKPIIENILEFRTSHNTGALWGIGRNLPYSSSIFAALSVGAGLFICYWLFHLGNAVELKHTAALGLIMAGAIGNCYDRIVLGYVRDFVHFHVDSIGFNFAIFNFADNMLVVGASLLVILAFRAAPETPGVELPQGTAEPTQAVSLNDSA